MKALKLIKMSQKVVVIMMLGAGVSMITEPAYGLFGHGSTSQQQPNQPPSQPNQQQQSSLKNLSTRGRKAQKKQSNLNQPELNQYQPGGLNQNQSQVVPIQSTTSAEQKLQEYENMAQQLARQKQEVENSIQQEIAANKDQIQALQRKNTELQQRYSQIAGTSADYGDPHIDGQSIFDPQQQSSSYGKVMGSPLVPASENANTGTGAFFSN